MKYLIAIDQGTTSSRTILFDENLVEVGRAQKEFEQIFPKPGWVEHDAEVIWETQLETLREVLDIAHVSLDDIAGIGITNQRETVVVWDKSTGKPVYNAIVWQDRRTAGICEDLKAAKLENYIRDNTGLVIDAYFSGTKIKWILDTVPQARQLAAENKLLCGTIDCWLIWKLTNGNVHATDVSNASRTMLFNIKSIHWDTHLLQTLNIPANILPEVKNSIDQYGFANIGGKEIPILGVAGDQQAALFGQRCFEPGTAKNTYGTGCFMLMQTGNKMVISQQKLLTTIAWGINGKISYALEGSVFIGGAVVQWLRDSLQIISSSEESEYIAASLHDNGDVYFVPAFTGLGAPHWDMYAKGTISGLTRGTGRAHIIRAALESIAYQTRDVLQAMNKDAGIILKTLQVDGGATANNWLMQFQSDILQTQVVRPEYLESTALGAASLAGIGAGLFTIEDLATQPLTSTKFKPKMKLMEADELYFKWHTAVVRAKG